MSSDKDNFPGNDDIYQQILDMLEQNKFISVQKKEAVSPLLGNLGDNSIKSVAAFIVYPKEPIYDVDDLNRFAEDNLVPLFRSFKYQEPTIQNKYFLRYIPIPGQSFMTVPCLKRKDEHLAVSIFGPPDHEIHYHILLVPDKSAAFYLSLPNREISDKYTIKIKNIKAAKKTATQQVLA